MKRNRWKPLIWTLSLTPVFLLFGMISGGAGHGAYIAMRLLLPFASLVIAMPDTSFQQTLTIALAIAQWPIYGLIASLTHNSRRVWFAIFAVHIALVLLLFTLWRAEF